MIAPTRITKCRLCGNTQLETVLDLGAQALTGVFPGDATTDVPVGPLELLKCHGEETCGLVQLAHDYDLGEMYGDQYGYRSGLNASMVKHLAAKVASLVARRPLDPGDVVLDIGANDGTTLSQYPTLSNGEHATLVGIDPTIKKFGKFYPDHIRKVPEFFSAATFRAALGKAGKPKAKAKARIITSISMFYDLPAPMRFVEEVASVLADDGIWHLEQSYLPLMLETNSYDTVCHEHVEYYALAQIRWMTSRAGLRIVDVQRNDVNGGSFAVTVAKGEGDAPIVAEMLEEERGLTSLDTWRAFAGRVARHRIELPQLLDQLREDGAKIAGLGASTKGNVVLQHCGITRSLLPEIAEVNPDKFGCFTPGSKIPIVSEADMRAKHPDVLVVLPWHFKKTFLERERAFLAAGGKLLFPLPSIELVSASSASS